MALVAVSAEDISSAWEALGRSCAAQLLVSRTEASLNKSAYASISAPSIVRSAGADDDDDDDDDDEGDEDSEKRVVSVARLPRMARGEWRFVHPTLSVRSVVPLDWPRDADLLGSWPDLWVLRCATESALATCAAAVDAARERTECADALNWIYTLDARWCSLAVAAVHRDQGAARGHVGFSVPMVGVSWVAIVPMDTTDSMAKASLGSASPPRGGGDSTPAGAAAAAANRAPLPPPAGRVITMEALERGRPRVWAFPRLHWARKSLEWDVPEAFDDASYVRVQLDATPGRNPDPAFFLIASPDRDLWRRVAEIR